MSYAICDYLGIKSIEINIGRAVEGIIREMETSYVYSEDGYIAKPLIVSNQTEINLPARIRTATLYAVAQSCNGRVSCNCNLSEKYLGWGTRWADTIGDFSPLSNLTSDEVVQIGEYLGLPKTFTRKAPSDGLCGKTDEDNFGFTYEVLNNYIRTGVCEDENVKQKIDNMHEKNIFKLYMMPCFNPNN